MVIFILATHVVENGPTIVTTNGEYHTWKTELFFQISPSDMKRVDPISAEYSIPKNIGDILTFCYPYQKGNNEPEWDILIGRDGAHTLDLTIHLS